MIMGVMVLSLSVLLPAAGQKAEVRDSQTEPLVSSALIQEAGWQKNWQLNLPVKADEQIDRVFIHGPYVYALTDSNILFCVDREKGRTLYAVIVCQRTLPLCSPLFYEGQLGFIAGNQFHVFDPSNGQIHQAEAIEQVGNIFACAIARNSDYIYIAGSDNRLHVISPDGYWQYFTASADNDSAINSVKANDQIIVFSTQAGNVVGMNPLAAEKKWQYDISGSIQAPLSVDEQFVYAAGMDAKLYKLTRDKGKLVWKQPFHTGAPIRDEVTLGASVVYAYNDLNGLHAVNKETGLQVWNLKDGREVICEAGDKAFVYSRPGVLKVLDNAAGSELYSINFSQVQRYAINTEDAVMYLADKKGRLMSVTVK
jgi:outer membrane protein assembly factor BamB